VIICHQDEVGTRSHAALSPARQYAVARHTMTG